MALAGGHAENDYVALLNVINGAYLLIFAHRTPGFAGHVALPYARLVQAPVYEAGAIEGAWALCAGFVTAALLG